MPVRKRRYVAVAAAVAVATTAAVVTVGVVRAPSFDPSPEPSPQVPEPTYAPAAPLSRAMLTGLQARRGPFCDSLPVEAVTTAIGGSAEASRNWNLGS